MLVVHNQQGGSNPRTMWWIGLSCVLAVLMFLVYYSFMRQPISKGSQLATTASPKEAAQVFLTAVASGDLNAANAMVQGHIFSDPQHSEDWNKISGLKVISLDEPFASPTNPSGWRVPYVAVAKNGETLKGNISVRNDGPDRKWQIDGIGF